MPRIRRKYSAHVTPDGLTQLRWGFDGPWQRFNVPNTIARRRNGASDCREADMAVCESAWLACRGELLASVPDPWQIWAYRRFELNVEPLGLDTGPLPEVPPCQE